MLVKKTHIPNNYRHKASQKQCNRVLSVYALIRQLVIFHNIIAMELPGLGVYKQHTVITIHLHGHMYSMAHYSLVYQLLLHVLGLTVAVHCQSYPRFEFNGSVLVNNSYILRCVIGEGVTYSLHCVTDYLDCCNNGLGNWYDETGMLVHQGEDGNSSHYVTRGERVVYLELTEVEECGDVIYLMVVALTRVYTSTLVLLQQVYHYYNTPGASSLCYNSLLIPVVAPEISIR